MGAGVFFVVPALALLVGLAVLTELRRPALLHAFAIAAFAALGLLDDLRGSRAHTGLRGHVTALVRERKVTTGLLKLVGGAATGVAIAWLARPRFPEALLDGALVALAANLINLLDLRPGRALKGFALGALALVPAAGFPGMLPLIAVMLPAAGYAPADLRARMMMGDTGSNALGAALGVTAVLHLEWGARLAILTLLLGLHLASERVSFSRVIERHPMLRFLDHGPGTAMMR